MVLRVPGMPVQNQHRATINRTEQVQHITEVRVVEVLREVTGHPLLQQNQAIAPVLLREAVAAEVVVHHTPEALEVLEVPVVLPVVQVEVHAQVHHQVEDNKLVPLIFKY